MAKAKTATDIPRESFVIEFEGQPAIEVKWLSDVVFASLTTRINGWLESAAEIEQELLESAAIMGSEAVSDYKHKLATCPLFTQTAEKAHKHLRTTFQRALEDLLQSLAEEAYCLTSVDLNHRCQVPHHKKMHAREDHYGLGHLHAMQRRQREKRLDLPPVRERRGGNKQRLISDTTQVFKFAKEADRIGTNKSYGDGKNKTLWEIICLRYDHHDPKWRERAKLDQDDVPDVVLDLVPQRRKFKLKTSHLALYHAAIRAGIGFAVITRPGNGKSFIQPSPATLLRRRNEVSVPRRKRNARTA